MTENIPQTSASDRVEAARALLADWDKAATPNELGLHDAGGFAMRTNVTIRESLRALITPPGRPLTVESDTVNEAVNSFDWPFHERIEISATELADLLTNMFRAGIQSAHETWEPADHPSQEMMLRWLGIDYWDGYADDGSNAWKIPAQSIEKEEI